jgi:hypothetical protein
MAFKEELEKDFIPRIEQMVRQQEAHIAYLKNKAKKKKYWRWLSHEAVDIDEIIDGAETTLNHLKGRLVEYKEYANNK